ncbi:MAG: protein translocase subunit SecD [Pirellulales bacterium]
MDNLIDLVLVAEVAEKAKPGSPLLANIAFVFAIFVLPFILSKIITQSLRLPALMMRMGIALAATIAAVLFVTTGQLRYGPDMKGGTTLIYNIIKTTDGLDPSGLSSALSRRVDPSGTKEATIRPRGSDQIEITVPSTDQYELQQIKNVIQTSGLLEFRVVANFRDHQDVIELARAKSNQENEIERKKVDVRNAEGRVVGRWYAVGRAEEEEEGIKPFKTPIDGYVIRNAKTGQMINLPQSEGSEYAIEKHLKSVGIESVDVLMALEINGTPYAEVLGDDLDTAKSSLSNMGEPTVNFALNSNGASKMADLTSSILPTNNFFRHMAIVMDGNVLSAPRLNNTISSNGEIQGRFTQKEVDFLVNILRQGKLPATLEKEPASETRVGAGLGEITIAKGKLAAWIAIIATAVTMIVYYHFSGIVATIALVLNIAMIFAVMIFIRQPLSLPGLAGIVLTIGMAVDSNVLVFERVREERAKGAADRLAVRNGFDRASVTIVDSNLTTLIAALVLYWIGTEQVRGFAVTLTIGILCSMFTAVFCSRIIFEVCEKLKLVSLSMMDGIALTKGKLVGERDLDYMSVRKLWITITVITTIIGVGAAIVRGPGLLNIDFTGGTTVTMKLTKPVPVQEMRELTKKIIVDAEGKPIESSLIRIDRDPQDQFYILTTGVDDEKKLAQMLSEGLAKNGIGIVTYDAKLRKLGSGQGSQIAPNSGFRFVSTRVQDPAPAAPDKSAPAQAAPAQAAPETPAPAPQTAPPATADAAATSPAPATSPASAPEVKPQDSAQASPAVPVAEPKVETAYVLELLQEGGTSAKRDQVSLREDLEAAIKASGVKMDDVSKITLRPDGIDNWIETDKEAYDKWIITFPLPEDQASKVATTLVSSIDNTPMWLSLSEIRGRVASEMQNRAVAALLVSLFFITAYIWFRFQKISYGLAAVLALIHDVFFTLGIIALSHWLADYMGFLLIEDFKIGLTEIAAFLAIIGYSLNDTIVIFDRVREIRGRSPRVTLPMLNASLNQTLSRTILTSGTTLLTVFVLYVWGGEGIHTFAFALLVGISVGTYSSMFVATPILYWLSGYEASANK